MSSGGISVNLERTRRARTKNASYIGDKFIGRDEEHPSRAEENPAEEEERIRRTLSNFPLQADSDDDTELMQPMRMYFTPSEYIKQVKISTRCYIHKAVEIINSLNLQVSEKNWFYNHPQFKHFFHMHSDKNHKVMGMWMLLLRTAEIEKKREAWFVVNGVPIRYSLREHALISGLDCHSYPENFTQMGGMQFAQRQFGQGVTITYAKVEEKLLKMKKYSADRLKMCVLYFLCSVIVGKEKTGVGAPSVEKFFIRAVDDLQLCETFPWGRYAFDQNLRDIQKEMDDYKGVVDRTCKFPSFCTSLEMLAFEAIPKLNKKFREDHRGAVSSCPRMCKSKFKPSAMKGFPLSDIYEVLGNTKEIQSLLVITDDEEDLLDRIIEVGDEDDVDDVVVDGWMKHIEKGKLVCFEEMYQEDVTSREEEEENEEEDQEAEEEDIAAIPVENLSARRENVATISMIVRLELSMDRGFKQINEKIDGLDKRVVAVEGYVKEQLDARMAFEGMDYHFNDNQDVGGVTEKDPTPEVSTEGEKVPTPEMSMEVEKVPTPEMSTEVDKEGEDPTTEDLKDQGVVADTENQGVVAPEVSAVLSTSVDMVVEKHQEKERVEEEEKDEQEKEDEEKDEDGKDEEHKEEEEQEEKDEEQNKEEEKGGEKEEQEKEEEEKGGEKEEQEKGVGTVIKRKRSSSEEKTSAEKEPEVKMTYKRRKGEKEGEKEVEKEVLGGEGRKQRKKKKSQLIVTPFTEEKEKGKRVTRQSKKQSDM